MGEVPHSCGGGNARRYYRCAAISKGVAGCAAHVTFMASYTAEDVAHLIEEDRAAIDSICMEGSDNELGLEDVEIVQNPYYHHTAEFDDFEEVQGRYTLNIKYSTNKIILL